MDRELFSTPLPWKGFYYVVQDDFEFAILLNLPPWHVMAGQLHVL